MAQELFSGPCGWERGLMITRRVVCVRKDISNRLMFFVRTW